MDRGSSNFSFGRAIAGIIGVPIMLVIELVSTMVVYTYLNLNHLETFGWLVRIAKTVLDTMAGQLDYWLKGSANAAYATLFGELGPKSILLLLIGLVVAAVIRGVVWLIRGLAGSWD